MDNHYGGVIWTNHALERLKQRSIDQRVALSTLKQPERSRFATNQSAWVYNRTFGKQDIEVVATRNKQREWVVMSVWSRPTQRSSHRYLVRNGLIDRLLDKIESWFSKK